MSSVYLSVYIASLFVSFVIVHVALYAKRECKIMRGVYAGRTVTVDLCSVASTLCSCMYSIYSFFFLSKYFQRTLYILT